MLQCTQKSGDVSQSCSLLLDANTTQKICTENPEQVCDIQVLLLVSHLCINIIFDCGLAVTEHLHIHSRIIFIFCCSHTFRFDVGQCL